MIHEPLARWRIVPGLAGHPVWRTAFEWLETAAANAPEGIHPLGIDGFYARVMSYALKEREVARYESHRKTIDVQYTVEGGEGIEFAAAGKLVPLGDYSAEKEVEHFSTPDRSVGFVENLAGRFTLILPGEPHMPQLRLKGLSSVRKVVVKIPAELVL